ncbi:MAG: hypothetical protein ABIG94_07540, partial [Pseudomonadota bacterium]
MTVVMRAVPSWRGVILATDDVIKPTKSVSPTTNGGSVQTYTYTIRLEQISDNTEQKLDAIFDILPSAFNKIADYVTNSSKLSVDGGTPQPVADPLREVIGGQLRLRWPASGDFSSDLASPNYFRDIRNFRPQEVKELSFQVNGLMGPNTINYNWVVLKPWNTLSGAQAPITRDLGTNPSGALLEVFKTVDTDFIPPYVPTDIHYTIVVTNQQGSPDDIQQIWDYLPPGFSYIGPVSGMTTIAPVQSQETINGVLRDKLVWTKSQFPGGIDIKINAGQTKTMTFGVRAIQSTSGSYYNEMVVFSK